jgi:hypothetical protein
MAKGGATHLVTLSRRGADLAVFPVLQEELNNQGTGCRLYCLTCDIAVENNVSIALKTI